MKQYPAMVFVNQLFATQMLRRILAVLLLLFIQGLNQALAAPLPSTRVSDIRNTKHNLGLLSSTGPTRNVQATAGSGEDEICVFCHTPHGGNTSVQGPLWNRSLTPDGTYNTYNSGSLDATLEGVALNQPNGISKLCLSCHDGTIAIGAVRVLDGSMATGPISMSGVEADGTMPVGNGVTTGFTRRLGTDLSNDHPISFTFDSALALKDGELRDPSVESHIGNRSPGNSPHVPLDNNQVQCNSCHDPHIRDASDPTKSIKFLRLNRFQKVSPTATSFNEGNDIICLACHNKDGWVGSAHATSDVANEIYTTAAANLREFPNPTAVWESACLACHDTHTVQGSRRLLREGTDGPTGANGEKQGGNPAIEETCFACHSSDGGTLTSQGLNTQVPDVKTDFTTMTTGMPISNTDQAAGMEKHDIGTVGSDIQETGQRGKDFIESQAVLGKASMGGSLANRHAECTDCHNPHRVTRRRVFLENNLGGALDSAGTHAHDISDITAETPYSTHNNIASGVLRGTFGVEPDYTNSNNFNVEPINFTIKRGDPGTPGYGTGTTAVTEPYVTREYQICLKCHSNYGYDTPPNLNGGTGFTSNSTTPININHMSQYTNQAREYNSPSTHRGEGQTLGADGGADSAFSTNNHRGWHPVVSNTGRTASVRSANANNWISPFNADVGNQTMYCTDCHGSNTPAGTADPDGAGYENGAVWGPHGSNNYFLLKGDWSGNVGTSAQNDYTNRTGTGASGSTDHLCFKCHDFNQYAGTGSQNSGFAASTCGGMCGGGGGGGGGGGFGALNNLHTFHVNRVGSDFRCNLCHVAVPHGWKNKNFLVNLNDVGPEGGFGGTGNQVRTNTTTGYVNGPYYNRAVLKVASFARSGSWVPGNCGSVGAPGNGATGVNWMAFSNEACVNVP